MQTSTAAIEAAAHQVAESLAAAQTAGVAFEEASARHDRIADRIRELDAERAGIVARRAAGDHRPDDGGRLELIAADREGLAAMETEAMAAVNAARGPADVAKQNVASARQSLAREESLATERALVTHATELDRLLLATVHELAEVGQRTGRPRPAWGPSAELAKELRKLQARRHEL